MAIEMWAAFAVAAGLLILLPGPTILLMIGYALNAGVRPALASLFGVALGDIAAMAVSFVGLAAVLATSAELFLVMKWLGAVYLVYLGIKMWRAPPVLSGLEDAALPNAELPSGAPPCRRHRHRHRVAGLMGQAFVVTFLNPKGILFFAAFMPQFIDPAAPKLPQMLLLGGTFVALAVTIAGLYILLAGWVRGLFRAPRTVRVVNRMGGSALIGAGALTASLQR